MSARFRGHTATAAVFVLAALVLRAGLGDYGLWDPDEGRHAAIARELFSAATWHGWIVPSHNFEPYHDKPILYYWLTALAYRAVGVNELGARLVSVLAAFATLVIVFGWTARMAGARTARLTVLVLASAAGFVALGRYGNLDTLLTTWVTLGVVAAERATADPRRLRWFVVAGAAAGFGMLTKGLVAPLFVGGIGLAHALVDGRALPRRARPYVAGFAAFVLVAGPWYAAAAIVNPGYLRELFLVHHLARFTSGTTTFHAGPWWYFGPAVVLLLFPWSTVLPATLVAAARDRDSLVRLCLSWAGIVVAFFSLSGGKLATYALPALPPLAILTARAVHGLPTASRAVRRLFVAGLGLVAVIGCAGLVSAAIDAPDRWRPVLDTARPLLYALPVATAAPLLLWWWRGERIAAAGVVAATLTLFLVFYLRVAPAVSTAVSEEPDAVLIAWRPEAPIVGYEVTPASLLFYSGRPVVRLSRPRLLRQFLEEHPFVWIVTSPRHVADIRRIATVFPWETTGRRVLYATGPSDDAIRAAR